MLKNTFYNPKTFLMQSLNPLAKRYRERGDVGVFITLVPNVL